MIRVDFYHLQKSSLEKVLPKLCEKAYSAGNRVKILLETEERIDFINSLLWTYDEESFLPHGTKKDGFVALQPIFISTTLENENNATVLILIDGATVDVEKLSGYNRILNIFDGNNQDAVEQARSYWKKMKSLDCELHYWQQNEAGIFEQKS